MTLSMHSQRHPWHDNASYPSFVPASSTSHPQSNYHAIAPKHINAGMGSVLASNTSGQQIIGRADAPTQTTYHRSDLPLRPIHDLPSRPAVQSYPTAEDWSRYHMGPAAMSSDEMRRSISPSNNSVAEGTTKYCLCQSEPHIPRPRNAFILYRQHQHAAVVAQNPNLPNPDISKIIGEQWRTLPDRIKEEWKALADEEKARHSQQYPDYRYRPKRSGRYSIVASIPGASPLPSEAQFNCLKCGGKPVNAPALHTLPAPTTMSENLHYPVWNPLLARPDVGLTFEKSNKMSVDQYHSSSSPSYATPFQQPHPSLASQHDPRTPQSLFQSNYRFPPNDHSDAKRRRLNETSPHQVGVLSTQGYSRPNSDGSFGRAGPPKFPSMMISPRTQLPDENVQRTPMNAQRRDPNLILPPLQTIANRASSHSQRRVTKCQKQTMEAMIMSIPVWNKVKILSQISPAHTHTDSIGNATNIRGAVIAIEGMDASTVSDMTNSLAEQLEKDGSFSVRIFGGPSPYHLLEPPHAGSTDPPDTTTLSFSECLGNIARWHLVSGEMKEFINGSSRIGYYGREVHSISHIEVPDAAAQVVQSLSATQLNGENTQAEKISSQATSDSAVSPKTVVRDVTQSSNSAQNETNSGSHTDHDKRAEPPRPRSRIPAAALAQSTATSKATYSDRPPAAGQPPNQEASTQEQPTQSQPRDQLSTSQTSTETQTPIAPSSTPATETVDSSRRADRAKSLTAIPVPVAIVPHYQLTTVNASAINMPIKDTYSPHSHWQWLATLWRGCIGPDITIVLKSNLDDGDVSADGNHSANSGTASAFPGTPASAHPQLIKPQPRYSHVNAKTTGVEIRLSDFKAIIVKTGGVGSGQAQDARSNAAGTPVSLINTTNSDAWEKAKRRVGFEVDEYLRK